MNERSKSTQRPRNVYVPLVPGSSSGVSDSRRPNSTGRLRPESVDPPLSPRINPAMVKDLMDARKQRSSSSGNRFVQPPPPPPPPSYGSRKTASPNKLREREQKSLVTKKFPNRTAVPTKPSSSSRNRKEKALLEPEASKHEQRDSEDPSSLSPRTISKLDRTSLELETQTLCRKVEILKHEKEKLQSTVEAYEKKLRSTKGQLKATEEDYHHYESETHSALKAAQDRAEMLKDERDKARKEAEKRKRDFSERKIQLERLREQLSDAGKALVNSKHAKDQEYEAEIAHLQERLCVAKERADQEEEKRVVVEEKLSRMESKIESKFENKLSITSASLRAAQEEADTLRDERNKARQQVEIKAEEANERKQQVEQLRDQLASAGKTLMETKEQKAKVRDEWKGERDSLLDKASSLEVKLAESKKSYIKVHNIMAEQEKEVESLRRELESTQKELAESNKKLDVADLDTSISTSINKSLGDELRLAQDTAKTAESKAAEIQKKLEEMTHKEEECEFKITDLKGELAAAEAKSKKSEGKAAAMKEKLDAIAKRHEEYRVQILQLKHGMKQDDSASILKDLEEMRKKHEVCQDRVTELEKELHIEQGKSKMADELQQKLRSMTKKLSKEEDQSAFLLQKLQTLEKERSLDKRNLGEQKKTIKDLTSRLEFFERRSEEIFDRNPTSQEGEQRMKVMLEQLTQATHRHGQELAQKEKEYQEKLSEQKTLKAGLQAHVEQLEKDVADLKDQVQSLHQEKKILQNKANKASSDFSNSVEIKERLDQLRSQILTKTKTIHQLEEQLIESNCNKKSIEVELQKNLEEARNELEQTKALIKTKPYTSWWLRSIVFFIFVLSIAYGVQSVEMATLRAAGCAQIINMLPYCLNQ